MKTSDLVLLDTNVIVYATDSSSPYHAQAKSIRDSGIEGKLSLCVCPQVLAEFFAVATNPKRVANPIYSQVAIVEVKKYFQSESIMKIYPKEDILERMIALFKYHPIEKAEIFDLQLIATMLSNEVSQIYTYDQELFTKFEEIKVLTP